MGLDIMIWKDQTLSHNYEIGETIIKRNIMYQASGYELGKFLSDAFEIDMGADKDLYLTKKTTEILQRKIDSLFKEPNIDEFLMCDLLNIKAIINVAIEEDNRDTWTWHIW
tara:strand:- start:995 stop:1327 length:333 start_codon:yes stop_codon:yes gene_type:complete